jgi:hypothetical protein
MRWFRFYDDAINDPKILKLSDNLFRVWVGILCSASKNDGKLPNVDDLALMIRIKPEKMRAALDALVKAGLIDTDGVISSPHNWDKRQFKSDVSNERVKRYRQRQRNVTETPPDTEQIQKQKEDAAPNGAQVLSMPQTPEKVFFDQAAQYLGNSGRSLAGSLLKSQGGNVPAAHAALLTAVQKSNPREYIGAIIRGREERECRPDRSF